MGGNDMGDVPLSLAIRLRCWNASLIDTCEFVAMVVVRVDHRD